MDFAYIVGRFQPLHNGHIELIQYMVDNFKYHTLFIGSSNVLCKNKNPLTFNERKAIIKKSFPNLNILPMDDFNDLKKWQQELNRKINHQIQDLNIKDIYFLTSSKENDSALRSEWMSTFNHQVINIKNIQNLSATLIRDAIESRDLDFIKRNTPDYSYQFLVNKYAL